ncbi:MAG: hypothetical protein ACP5KE_04340 [Candidatus Methanodesulfokora sp.]
MVGLKAVKAIKFTPSLLLKFLLIPARKVRNPCLYCPGICIASCPTFLRSGNLILSPLGYSRNPDLGRVSCLKCWRCVLDCPLNYELPGTFSEEIELRLEILREGSPMFVCVRGLDEQYGSMMAERLGSGLCILEGLLKRYDEGCRLNEGSLKRVKDKLKRFDKVISLSPEASHALDIPFFLEEASKFPVRIEYRGPIHIPCLLIDRAQNILNGLISIGANPTEVLRDSCIKLDKVEALALCPRASSKGLTCFYDIMKFM